MFFYHSLLKDELYFICEDLFEIVLAEVLGEGLLSYCRYEYINEYTFKNTARVIGNLKLVFA